MSKILDTLNNPFKKEKMRSSAQDEIAKIYLKVSDKNKNKKDKRQPKLPWAIAAVALFLALIVFLFKSNIDIKVHILGEIPSFGASETDRFALPREKGLYLLKGSEPNKYLIKKIGFTGDAKPFSKADEGQIILCNSKGSGWANYEISLKEPLDLTRLDIKYAAKGEIGGEYLTVAIVDSDNRAYRIEKDLSSTVSKDWEVYPINFKPFRTAIDLTNIVTVRFEFGSLTAGNNSMATIFLKDICVTKTKRVGW